MTVVNPKSISGINSITTGSGSDDILTIHTNNGTERLRIDSTGTTKIVTGIVTTLTATTGIVTTLTANTVTSLGAVSGTTGTFTGAISGTTGTFSGAVSGTTGTFSGAVSGTTGTFTSHVSLGDSDELRFGDATGGDLKIYHDGNNSAINDVGNGSLYIQGSDNIYIRDYDTSENHIVMTKNGAVDLYHNGGRKFFTESTGISVYGSGSTFLKMGSEAGGTDTVFFDTTHASNSKPNIDFRLDADLSFRMANDGDFHIVDGDLIFSTAGHGIDFSATSDASGATSELLADYEIGTFNVTVPENGSGNQTVTNNPAGRYTKIGDFVYIYIYAIFSGAPQNNASGWQIGGLPYAPSTSGFAHHGMGQIQYTVANNYSVWRPLISSSSRVYFHRTDGSNASLLNQDVVSVGMTYFLMGAAYMTA